MYPVITKGRYWFIDSTGKLLFELPKGSYNVSNFSEGLADFGLRTGEGLSQFGFGYFDTQGKISIEPKYREISRFSEGLAAIKVKEKMKWGFINKSGEVIIDAQFDSALPFSEGLASVRCRSDHPDRACRDKCGYIDKSGNWVIKPQFGIASSFSEGLARVATGEEWRPGMYGYINKEGVFVIPPTKYKSSSDFCEGLAMVQVHFPPVEECPPGRRCGDGVDKVGYIDKTGKMVIAPQFDGVYDVIYTASDVSEPFKYYSSDKERDFSEGLAAIRMEDRLWGYADKQGRIVIKPQFVYAGQFKEGLAAVAIRKSNKRIYGFINQGGQFIIQPRYDDVHEFKHGLAAVFFTNSYGDMKKWGYINKKGEYVWQPTR